MSEVASDDLFHSLLSTWETAIAEGRPREVIPSALTAYFLFRERKEEAHELATLIYTRSAIDSVLEMMGQSIPKPATLTCSFCYRTEPDVRLAAGPNVFICDSCVSTLSDVFQEKTSQ